MMTAGRLKAIEFYHARSTECGGLMHKCVGELLAEVTRLRCEINNIFVDCNSLFRDVQGLIRTAERTLAEPDLGQPDFVCRASDIDGVTGTKRPKVER